MRPPDSDAAPGAAVFFSWCQCCGDVDDGVHQHHERGHVAPHSISLITQTIVVMQPSPLSLHTSQGRAVHARNAVLYRFCFGNVRRMSDTTHGNNGRSGHASSSPGLCNGPAR